jgi:hypothetical protein
MRAAQPKHRPPDTEHLYGSNTTRPTTRPARRSSIADCTAPSGRRSIGSSGTRPARTSRISLSISDRLPTCDPRIVSCFSGRSGSKTLHLLRGVRRRGVDRLGHPHGPHAKKTLRVEVGRDDGDPVAQCRARQTERGETDTANSDDQQMTARRQRRRDLAQCAQRGET